MNITKLIMCMLLLVLSLQSAVALENSNNKNKIINSPSKTTKTVGAVKNNSPMAVKWSQVDQIPGLIAAGKINPQFIPNPHWKEDACLACHKRNANKASSANLRKKNTEALCNNCHDVKFDHSYIHPVNIKLNKKMKRKIKPIIKKSLVKTGGKINCSTCHDLTIQCLPEQKRQKRMNSGFFRGGPFKTRTEQCYFCHDEALYPRLNPHDQVDDAGNLKQNTCRVCHAGSVQKLLKAKNIEQVRFITEDNLSSLCWGCHRLLPHPGGQYTFFSSSNPKPGPDHLVKPSEKTLKIMKRSFDKNNIKFPLEPGTGKVFCGTCHNAHEKGVIKNKALAWGAGENKRLRMQTMCNYCHDM